MAAFSFAYDVLADTLEAAGYDVDPAPASARTVSGRHDGVQGGVATVVIDAGGRLRYTLTRNTAPEQARQARIAGRPCKLVTTTTQTTVAELVLSAAVDLARCLADLEASGS